MTSDLMLNPDATIGHNNPPIGEELALEFVELVEQIDVISAEAKAWPKDDADPRKLKLIEDELQAPKLLDLSVRARAMIKTVDDTRKLRIRPLKDQIAEIDGWFGQFSERMFNVSSAFRQLVDTWDLQQREKARREATERARIAEETAKKREAELAAAAASQSAIEQEAALAAAIEAAERAKVAAHKAATADAAPTRAGSATISQVKTWSFRITDHDKLDRNKIDGFTLDVIEKALRAHAKKHKDTRPVPGVEFFQETGTRLRA